jgi:hypothetical protein
VKYSGEREQSRFRLSVSCWQTMAVHFDESKFSAIDALFDEKGGGIATRSASSAVAASDRIVTASSSSKRAGLGANNSSSTGPNTESSASASTRDIQKRLLQVGTTTNSSKKRRRHGEAYDSDGEDEAEEQPKNSNLEGSDDEQEEIGRTAMIQERPPNPATFEYSETEHKMKQKKKKKKGKKERQKEQETLDKKVSSDSAQADADATTTTTTTTTASYRVDATLDQNEEKLPESATTTNGEGGPGDQAATTTTTTTRNNAKKKRRKIRSRQKNIYKDKRDIKPDHLRVEKTPSARHQYQGRPLTAETRAKLSLPPSKSSSLRLAAVATSASSTMQQHADSNSPSFPVNNERGDDVLQEHDIEQGERIVAPKEHFDTDAALLLSSSKAEADAVTAKKKSKKKSRAKKPKYKNLL